MNTLTTFLCFALVASAAAITVGNHGYNYQRQSFRPSQPAGHSSIYSVQQSPPLASFSVPTGPAPQFNAQPFEVVAPPQYAAPTQQYIPQYAAPVNQFVPPVQQPVYSAPAPVAQYQPTSYRPQQRQTIVSKEVFVHSAPEETEEIDAGQGVAPGPNRKNYRVVFIKAPAQNLRLNLESLKRAQANNEEKTAIYVLSKKPDLGDLGSQLSAIQTEQKAHKPEVFFIKYKTQEEAQRAQQEIQAQYDSLGGSTSITDGGVSPVRSVIGSGSVGPSFSGGNAGSVGPSFSGGSAGSVGSSFSGGNGGSIGSSFSGGSSGSSFTGGNVGGSSFTGGNNFASQQQQFVQQSFQSSHGSTSSSVSFGSSPSQKYLPASKK